MPFNFKETGIDGLKIIEPRVFGDARGFFVESYKRSDFVANGIDVAFVQDNHSCSERGVLRGLHYQLAPQAQAKLVRVVRGAVWDVAVDLRPGSESFGRWYGLELSAENSLMFYIPAGFAHGFLTLQDNTHFMYKCSAEYAPELDRGVIWNDPAIGIEWPLAGIDKLVISEKDERHPLLKDAERYTEGV